MKKCCQKDPSVFAWCTDQYCFLFRNAWFAIDLGVWFIPSCYTLRHARGYGRWALHPHAFTSKLEQILIKNSPSYILSRSVTSDLLVASPDALPLNYRRLMWPKVAKLGSFEKHTTYSCYFISCTVCESTTFLSSLIHFA